VCLASHWWGGLLWIANLAIYMHSSLTYILFADRQINVYGLFALYRSLIGVDIVIRILSLCDRRMSLIGIDIADLIVA